MIFWGRRYKALSDWVLEQKNSYQKAILSGQYGAFSVDAETLQRGYRPLRSKRLSHYLDEAKKFWQQAEIETDFAEKLSTFLTRLKNGDKILKAAGLVAQGALVSHISERDQLLVCAFAAILRAEQQKGVILVARSEAQAASLEVILRPLAKHKHKTIKNCMKPEHTEIKESDIYIVAQDAFGTFVLEDLTKEDLCDRHFRWGVQSVIVTDLDYTAILRANQPCYLYDQNPEKEQQHQQALRQAWQMSAYLQEGADWYFSEAPQQNPQMLILTDQGRQKSKDLSTIFSEQTASLPYLLELVVVALITRHYFQLDQHYRLVNGKIFPMIRKVAPIIGKSPELYLNMIRLKEGIALEAMPEILDRIRLNRLLKSVTLLGGVAGYLSRQGQEFLTEQYRRHVVTARDAENELSGQIHLPYFAQFEVREEVSELCVPVLEMLLGFNEHHKVPILFMPEMEAYEELHQTLLEQHVQLRFLPVLGDVGEWQMLLMQARQERLALVLPSLEELNRLKSFLSTEDDVGVIFIGDPGNFYQQRALMELTKARPQLNICGLVAKSDKDIKAYPDWVRDEFDMVDWSNRQKSGAFLDQLQGLWWHIQQEREISFAKMEAHYAKMLPFLERVHI